MTFTPYFQKLIGALAMVMIALGCTFIVSCGDAEPETPATPDTEMEVDTTIDTDDVQVDDDPEADADAMREDMDAMNTIDGITIEAGSTAASIQEWMSSGTGQEVFILDKIPLEESDELSAEGKAQLDALAALLKANPDVNVEIQGHTAKAKNAIGAAAKVTMSGARALWVKTKLTLRGVEGSRLDANGYGDEQLLTDIAEDDPAQKRIAIALSK